MKTAVKVLLIYVGVSWLIGVPIYLGVYFSIFRLYFSGSWHDSICEVQQITHYVLSSPEVTYDFYNLLSVRVKVDERWLRGFGCGTSNSRQQSAETTGSTFPYLYYICPDKDSCGNMMMMPRWMCKECIDCSSLYSNFTVPCMYSLSPSSVVSSAADLPNSYDPEFPQDGGTYIVVVLGKELYYPKSEWYALHIVAGGGLIGGPILTLAVFGAVVVVKRCKN